MSGEWLWQPATREQRRILISGVIDMLGENGESWTKGSWARDAEGKTTMIDSDRACKFCVGGALTLVARRLGCRADSEFMVWLMEAIGKPSKTVTNWNDESEWDQIRDGLKLALEGA